MNRQPAPEFRWPRRIRGRQAAGVGFRSMIVNTPFGRHQREAMLGFRRVREKPSDWDNSGG